MPGNRFREELERVSGRSNRFRAELERMEAEPSAGGVALETAGRGFANNVLAIPSASGRLAADAVAAGRAGVKYAAGAGMNNLRSLVGMDRVERPGFGERFDRERDNPVLDTLAAIPRPTYSGVTSAAKSVPALMPGGESPGEAYDRNLFAAEGEEAQMRAAHPTAAAIGDIGGDVASLLVGRRVPGADRLIRRAETRLGGRGSAEMAENLAQDFGKILKGPTAQRIARGAGRSVEAGVEAAVLDVLKDPNADPLETAAIAAGGQLVGSSVIGGAQGLVSGGLSKAALNVTVAAASTWGFLQVLKSATPGGEDRILESMESGYDKVALMLGLGLASAALGATRHGRGNVNLSDQTRAFLDGTSASQRGITLSLLTDWTEGDEDDRAAIERTLTAISNNPQYQGDTEAERSIVRQIRRGSGLERRSTGGEF